MCTDKYVYTKKTTLKHHTESLSDICVCAQVLMVYDTACGVHVDLYQLVQVYSVHAFYFTQYTHMVDVIFFVEGKSKRENVVFLMVWTPIVEDILWRDTLPACDAWRYSPTLSI